MSNVKKADFMRLLSQDSIIAPDLTIKFDGEEIKAHKNILSLVSSVYEQQFFGPLSKRSKGELTGDMEIIEEDQFGHSAYLKFVRYIYGDQDGILKCNSYELLFELLQMSQHFLMEGLEKLVRERINSLAMSLNLLLPSLATTQEYDNYDGFKEICEMVRQKIVSKFSGLTAKERAKFFKDNRENNPDLVETLMDLMVKEKVCGTKAKPDLCIINSNAFYKYYEEHQKDPAVIRVLDNIMNDFVYKAVGLADVKDLNKVAGKKLDKVPSDGTILYSVNTEMNAVLDSNTQQIRNGHQRVVGFTTFAEEPVPGNFYFCLK